MSVYNLKLMGNMCIGLMKVESESPRPIPQFSGYHCKIKEKRQDLFHSFLFITIV